MNARKLKKLENEQCRLTGLIDSLHLYMHTQSFEQLSEKEKQWLREQYDAMRTYEDILIMRVNFYNRQREAVKKMQKKEIVCDSTRDCVSCPIRDECEKFE